MKPHELEQIPLQIEKLFDELQDRIMLDVVRRINKTGEITSTADYQINKMTIIGQSSEFIESEIKRLTKKTDAEVWQLYEDVIDKDYTRNKAIYEQVNAQFIPYDDNLVMQQWVNSIVTQTRNELLNITQSMGFALNYGGKTVFTPFSEYYQKYLDRACMDIVTGSFDYNTVLRRVVKEMTSSGIRTVDYASGYSSRITVAARRAMLTGVNQLSSQVNEKMAKDLGTDTFEVTYHAGARPTHWWGGMVFTHEDLERVCGLGDVGGLCGANCRHNYLPFIPGVSVRTYTDEQLSQMREEEEKTHTWAGKEYNAYEATQKQRQMENTMRAQRERVKLLQSGHADPDIVMLEKARYQGQLDQYAAFSKRMGIPQQRERIYLDIQGRVATNSKRQNAKYTKEMIANADIDNKQYERFKKVLGRDAGTLADFRQIKYNNPEKWKYINGLKEYIEKYPTSDKRFFDVQQELNKAGIKIGIPLPVVKKQAFILPDGKHDPYHIMNRMLERQITDDNLREYINNANCMFIQWRGARQRFVGTEGMVVVAKSSEDWIYKTAWKKDDYDDEAIKILEVLKKHGI